METFTKANGATIEPMELVYFWLKFKDNIHIWTERLILAVGLRISNRDLVLSLGPTVPDTRVTIKKEKSKVPESFSGKTVASTTENLTIITYMVRVFIYGLMAENM